MSLLLLLVLAYACTCSSTCAIWTGTCDLIASPAHFQPTAQDCKRRSCWGARELNAMNWEANRSAKFMFNSTAPFPQNACSRLRKELFVFCAVCFVMQGLQLKVLVFIKRKYMQKIHFGASAVFSRIDLEQWKRHLNLTEINMIVAPRCFDSKRNISN